MSKLATQPKQLNLFYLSTAGSKLHQAILEGFDSLHKYIHSGEIEELNDVIPYEDFTDYTAEDFIEDHAIETIGDDEETGIDSNSRGYDDEDDNFEPSSKRFRSDHDSYDNDDSNDYDSRYGRDGPGIPSLLNLNVNPPRRGQELKNVSEKSPLGSPWQSSANFNNNNNNGDFGGNQSANNKQQPNKDRREGRRGSSRWSSRR